MAKTIEQGFDSFLSWLQPLTSEHDKARSHKDSVKSCMENNFDCSRFFETGSFGNGTGVRHYSDTDYFAVIPAAKLKQNSSTSLREIKDALIYKFPRTEGIVVNCPAVRVPFGLYASEKLEVTPACFGGLVKYDERNFNQYEIPDCDGGWMYSSPGAHNHYVQVIDNRLSNKVKSLIRLVKAWKYYNNVPILSFFLELYVARYCYSESSIVYWIDLVRIFNKLEEGDLPGMNDPVGISGRIKPCQSDAKHEEALSKVKTVASRARRALEQINAGKLDEAFATYDLLFYQNFPAR